MLKKVLKYDMRRVFKLWWIFAVSILAGSVLVGLCYRAFVHMLWTLEVAKPEQIGTLQGIVEGLASIFGGIGMLAIAIAVSFLSLYVYFLVYKSLYSAEGALTFMLPMKRSRLLDEKYLFILIWQFINTALTAVAYFIIGWIAMAGRGDMLRELFDVIFENTEEVPAALVDAFPGLLAEMGVMFVAACLSTTTLVVLCLTIGAVIARKQKLLAGIGVYYGIVSALMLLAVTAFFIIGIAVGLAGDVSDAMALRVIHGFLGGFSLLLIVTAFVYRAVTRHLIHKKLNLTN